MTTQAGVRLVKCPRCRKILPEVPEVSMYQCGWCGTVLQGRRQENVLGQTQEIISIADLTDAPEMEFSSDHEGLIPCEDECNDSHGKKGQRETGEKSAKTEEL